MVSLEEIKKQAVPKHIAIIMDGNGRWAKQRGAARVFGHQNAVEAVRAAVEGCGEAGVGFLTLYAFSTENWARPRQEVNALMSLLVSTIRQEVKKLNENNVRLKAIGQLSDLPPTAQQELQDAIALTAHNTGLTLTLALSYSGRWDLTQAMQRMAEDVRYGRLQPEAITADTIGRYLSTSFMPEPELLIRTSGEMRISNFMLWELAYTELYFTPILWPDFRKQHLFEAIRSFQQRERRFGKISEQVKSE
ncbi:undecaprenyl diphosphate synthase [Thermonema lapsum]|jgi:undecaprenyl diphosphate synthase|uniref:Isoprenyl transferase n=1 Tax=Thermonema lapsum TaxID=28195 RepID=A0A846MQV2_9BACT|nr:isoprenyl transferase [Thermonema lapsum]NIK73839.1 undecaprenyl diphosphate synthase [Thermonema lapsum]